MASDTDSRPSRPAMTVAELVAFARKEFAADAERQAKVSAASAGEGLHESQTGATLDLSHKNIRALPVEVVFLIKDKVERLALSHNPQIAVPTQIVQCDRLRYLNIRWNSLKCFPEAVLQLSSLEILDLSKNKIMSIPEDIKKMASLKFLAVARNRIARLPLALGEMASLSKLKFDENPIEFPPPDAFKAPITIAAWPSTEVEKDQDVCQRVKRFLRQAALRERLKTASEEDLSESNIETPRPSRRPIGGRFPVRPSISGIDSIDDLRNASSSVAAPPIPLRSHARVTSSQNVPTIKRPGLAPLTTGGNDISRSRSETVSSSASLRARRQGIVPPKRRALGSLTETAGLTTSRPSTASTIRPSHSRNGSTPSTLNGFLIAGSGGESSSGAVSPIDSVFTRNFSARRLSSLPENRNSNLQTSDFTRAAKRLSFTLFQLRRPVHDVAIALKQGTPRRSVLERQLFSANAQAEELGRLLDRLDSGRDEGSRREQDADMAISFASTAALKSYSIIAAEMKQYVPKMTQIMDAIYVRSLMFQIYTTMIEARNICTILGFKTLPPGLKSTPRVSRAWSSRTVTPTQVKAPVNRRMRGATILQNTSSTATVRVMPPPVPLNGSSSRTNTMTSLSGTATPRSGESFTIPSVPPTASLPSRSNTMRSNFITACDVAEDGDQFERIFLKLQMACNQAAQALPRCHAEITVRKDNADNAGHVRMQHFWSLALTKCNATIVANNALIRRLSVVKLGDPYLKSQRDFWQLCDTFVQSWAELATNVKDLGQQRGIDITTIKGVMKPVQRAMKDVSKTISDSPIYHQALRPSPAAGANGQVSAPLAPPFPAGINAAFAQAVGAQSQSGSGYVTPVPATPLSAALGPAVQATVASIPREFQQEYLFAGTGQGGRAMHERADTVMQSAAHLRR